MSGKVYLVGAGPGASDLITLRGVEYLRRAEVLVHDRLVHRDLLAHVRPETELIYVGKTPNGPTTRQEQINEILVAKARSGRQVVRLKGGDPFVFGRGWEEIEACHQAGIAYEVVPGVSSALAAPGAAGIPVTHRGMSRTFAVVAGRFANNDELDYEALSRLDTVVVLMGRDRLPYLARRFMAAGKSPETPAAVVECGTTEEQRVLRCSLKDLAQLAEQQAIKTPSTIVIGEVAGLAESLPQLSAPVLKAVAR